MSSKSRPRPARRPSAETAEPEGTYRKRKLGLFFWLAVVWLTVLILAAVFADLLPLKDPNETFRGVARNGPSAAGTGSGPTTSATTCSAGRSSAPGAHWPSPRSATVCGLTIGAAVGLVAGFYRRSLDSALMAFLNILLAIPSLVLLLALISFLAPPGTASPAKQTFWATIALAILTVPTIARVTRAQTMVWGDRDFVMASRTLGARNKRIMVREIFPNVVPTLLSFAFTLLAALIIVEAALAFFGIGDVSGVSWGIMIQNGRSQLERSPHMVLFPAAFMFLTIISLNFVGDQLRTRFDVRESGI